MIPRDSIIRYIQLLENITLLLDVQYSNCLQYYAWRVNILRVKSFHQSYLYNVAN